MTRDLKQDALAVQAHRIKELEGKLAALDEYADAVSAVATSLARVILENIDANTLAAEYQLAMLASTGVIAAQRDTYLEYMGRRGLQDSPVVQALLEIGTALSGGGEA